MSGSLMNFRQCYLVYPEGGKLDTLRRESDWSHYHLADPDEEISYALRSEFRGKRHQTTTTPRKLQTSSSTAPPWPNGPISLSPGQRPGARTPKQPWPNGPASLSLGQRPGARAPKQPWPNGPTSLSPGQRPGWMTPIDRRPEGSRSGLAWFGAQLYRTPLGRGALTVGNPGRCPGLRNQAPLVPLKS